MVEAALGTGRGWRVSSVLVAPVAAVALLHVVEWGSDGAVHEVPTVPCTGTASTEVHWFWLRGGAARLRCTSPGADVGVSGKQRRDIVSFPCFVCVVWLAIDSVTLSLCCRGCGEGVQPG